MVSARTHSLVPLLFTLCAVSLCTALGIWQVQRLGEKQALIAQIEQAQDQSALGTLPDTPDASVALIYRKAVLTGKLLPEHALRFIGQKSSGYVWLVPFKLEDSDTVLMASLGWRPSGETPAIDAGIRTLQGTLRPPRHKRYFSPENQPQQNLWFTDTPEEMRAATGLNLLPVVLETGPLAPVRNDHLGYAVTWFALAGVAGVMYGVWRRHRMQ